MKILSQFVLVAFLATSLFSCQTDKQETPIPQSLMDLAREAVTGSGGADSIVMQDGKMVGVLYAPPASSPTHSNQYWALSSDYVYINSKPNAKLDLVPVPPQYNNPQEFRAAMKAKFKTGKFVTVNVFTEEVSLFTSVQYPYN